ncbi:MAG TPA: flagellin [Candidatus Ozemobacteraceae bacterium]|nr:flagellin [Candidatus Ozemobacteraceae bacterium]
MVEKTSLSTANRLNELHRAQDKTIQRIASGKQILSAADDPAALAVSMALESQTRGLARGIANRQDEISLLQTAEGGMAGISEMTQRIRELSVQAANGTLTAEDRQAIQAEIAQLNAGIDQTVNMTTFNTKPLLDGSLKMQLQNGNTLAIPAFGAAALGTSGIDVMTAEGAGNALTLASRAGEGVVSERARLGAVSNGIAGEVSGLQQQLIDTVAAQSRIADADLAQQVIALTSQQLQQQVATSVFKLDETSRSRVLSLLS